MTSFDHIANNKVEANFHKDKIIALCEKFEKNSNEFYEKAKDLIEKYDNLWNEYYTEYQKIDDTTFYYHWIPTNHSTIFVNNASEVNKIHKLAQDCDEYLILSADAYNHLEMICADYHVDYEVTRYQNAIRSLETKLANIKRMLEALEKAKEPENKYQDRKIENSAEVGPIILVATLITVFIIGGILCLV